MYKIIRHHYEVNFGRVYENKHLILFSATFTKLAVVKILSVAASYILLRQETYVIVIEHKKSPKQACNLHRISRFYSIR